MSIHILGASFTEADKIYQLKAAGFEEYQEMYTLEADGWKKVFPTAPIIVPIGGNVTCQNPTWDMPSDVVNFIYIPAGTYNISYIGGITGDEYITSCSMDNYFTVFRHGGSDYAEQIDVSLSGQITFSEGALRYFSVNGNISGTGYDQENGLNEEGEMQYIFVWGSATVNVTITLQPV